MADARYGINILGELSDAQALPDNTSADSTNMVFVGGLTNGKLYIQVRACSAISIADSKALTIELETYSSDTAASAIAPFSHDGAAHSHGSTSMRIFYVLASGGAVTYDAGEIIVDVAVPDQMMALFSTPHTYVQLKYTTTANESSETVDAFVYSRN